MDYICATLMVIAQKVFLLEHGRTKQTIKSPTHTTAIAAKYVKIEKSDGCCERLEMVN